MSDVSSNSDTVVSNNDDTVIPSAGDDLTEAEVSVKQVTATAKQPSRLHQQTAASKGRSKVAGNQPLKKPSVPAYRARQLPPRPPAKVVTASKPALTPTKKNAPKKACSTPTSEDMTISDMTLDASCISVVNRTRAAAPNLMDETVTEAPVLKMRTGPVKRGGLDNTVVEMGSSSTSGNTNVRRHTMVPPRNNTSGGKLGGGNTSGGRLGTSRTAVKVKPLLPKVAQTVTKTNVTLVEENDEEEITDEMMNIAYTRYLQAKFIEMRSRQAKEKAEKDCEKQLFHVFSATESLRQEMMRKQEEKLMWSNIAMMKKSLEVVETKLSPALMVLDSVNDKLSLVGAGLDKVKHNLIVQGVNLEDQETAARELESLSEMFKKFNEDVLVHRNVIEAEGMDVARMAEEYSSLAQKYSRTVQLIEECKSLLEQADQLTNQEASLAISLSQLEMEKRKKRLEDTDA